MTVVVWLYLCRAIVQPTTTVMHMSNEEFLELHSSHQSSGLTLKSYLKQIGTSYSTYNYWRKKYGTAEGPARDLAPISIRHKGVLLRRPSLAISPPACRCCSTTAFAPISAAGRRKSCWSYSTRACHPIFCLNDKMRYFLYPGGMDMRKGISSQCVVVHKRMRNRGVMFATETCSSSSAGAAS